jgi:hypothetical protein
MSVDKSPTSVDVNSLLAEINLPQTRFDNVLMALGHGTETNAETEDNPDDDTPADKDEDDGVQPPSKGHPISDSTGSPTIRISKNTDSNPPTSNPAKTTTTRSILRGTPPAETTRRTTTEAADYQMNDDPSNVKRYLINYPHLFDYGRDGGHTLSFEI